MNHNVPKAIRDKVHARKAQFEHLADKAKRSKDAIDRMRERLSGSFASDAEYNDTMSTLRKLIADLPSVEKERAAAEDVFDKCQAFLDELPDDAVVEQVAADPGDLSLDDTQQRIAQIEDELKELKSVPLLAGGIETFAQNYVRGLARPRLSGISPNEELKVVWPSDMAAMFAALFPEKMVEVIVAEARRLASTPMPLPQRQQRIGQLERELDRRRRQAHKLGAEITYSTPAEIVLGVKVVRSSVPKSPKMKLAPRVTA